MSRKHSGRRVQARRSRPDVLRMLHADHERILDLFTRYARKSTGRDAPALLEAACRGLEVHAQIEHELFYPAIREVIDCRAWLAEGEVEHRTLDVLLAELRGATPGEPRCLATGAVLLDLLRRHLGKEERRIFAQVRRSSIDVAGLAELLESRRQDILEQRAVAAPRRANAGAAGYSGFASF